MKLNIKQISIDPDTRKIIVSFLAGAAVWIILRKIPFITTIIQASPLSGLITGNLLRIISFAVDLMGIKNTIAGDTISIQGARGIKIIYECLAISQMGLISGLIISYPGPAIKKIWFTILSIFSVHLLNAIRLIVLAVVLIETPTVAEVVHYFLTRILIYLGIFGLWYIWIRYLSAKK